MTDQPHDEQTCRYRRLYEGSQRTLADMASRQADALSRVGRIRAQIVNIARRTYPRLFVRTEREIGTRISDLTDEVLVSYIESFMLTASGIDPGVLEELRIALQHAGIPVPSSGFDLDRWITAVQKPRPIPSDTTPEDSADSHASGPTPRVDNSLDNLFDETVEEPPHLIDERDYGNDDGLDSLFDAPDPEPPPPEPPPPPEHTLEETNVRNKPQRTEPSPSWPGAGAMKPTLFPTRTPPKTHRRRRTSAIPGSIVPDVPGTLGEAATVEVTDDIRDQLLAASALPHPIFTSDLAALIGSPDVVEAWQRERQQGDLTVRFVLPKPRHRQRGALVVPQGWLKTASAETARSVWVMCLRRFRGAKLYELGVFFHRFREQVVSYHVDDDVVAVRLSLPQGIVGVILVLGATLKEEGRTRGAIADAIDTFLTERLTQVAILATNANRMQAVEELVTAEAQIRNWQAPMPVTLSLSWEYADGTGVTRPLLGV